MECGYASMTSSPNPRGHGTFVTPPGVAPETTWRRLDCFSYMLHVSSRLDGFHCTGRGLDAMNTEWPGCRAAGWRCVNSRPSSLHIETLAALTEAGLKTRKRARDEVWQFMRCGVDRGRCVHFGRVGDSGNTSRSIGRAAAVAVRFSLVKARNRLGHACMQDYRTSSTTPGPAGAAPRPPRRDVRQRFPQRGLRPRSGCPGGSETLRRRVDRAAGAH